MYICIYVCIYIHTSIHCQAAPSVPLPQTCGFRACRRTRESRFRRPANREIDCEFRRVSRNYVPAEGLDFASHCEFPLRALHAQKWHANGVIAILAISIILLIILIIVTVIIIIVIINRRSSNGTTNTHTNNNKKKKSPNSKHNSSDNDNVVVILLLLLLLLLLLVLLLLIAIRRRRRREEVAGDRGGACRPAQTRRPGVSYEPLGVETTSYHIALYYIVVLCYIILH